MSHLRPGPRETRLRLIGVLTALWCLLPLVLLSGPASGAPPTGSVTPTGVVASVSTTQDGVDGAVPEVLAQAGVTPITLTLTLTPDGATFKKDTPFALDLSLVKLDGTPAGTPTGTLSQSSLVIPGGQNLASTTVTYSAVENGVVVTPRMTTKPPKDFTSTAAQPFQSLKRVTTTPAGPGAAVTVGTDVCGPGMTDVACATVFLPQGTTSANAVTTVGACTPDLGCPEGSEVVGFIADLGENLPVPVYTREAPAQIIIRCAASRCGNGGINSYTVHLTFDALGPLSLESRPCVAKGVADDGLGNDFCTDYVSSTRDGGDLLLVVNVLHDFRGAV